MRAFFATAALGLYSLLANAQANPAVDAFLARQLPISKAGLLANIGPDGSRSSGAKAGVVIASPSTQDPDYLYTWTRDASLVFQEVVAQFTRGEDPSLRKNIDDFVASQAQLQTVSNPSGTISTGGLGEPKFNIDLTQYTGAWGRPQRDGPPLRSIALIGYANWLLENGNATHLRQRVWPVIKLDLDYTARFWNYTGFDLWEEVSSSSFFTTVAQHRALHEGATLATALGETSSATSYSTQAANVLCFQQSYWNPSRNYVTANTGGGRSGIDANTLLASVHTFDPAAGCDNDTFQPCSEKALANHKAYVDAFRSIYRINNGIPSTSAVATGRYSEDVYYGGQPWYLTTAVAAEQLYDALIVWNKQQSLEVTGISLAFFRQFSSSVQVGSYASTTPTFTTLTNAIRAYADGFIAVIQKYTPADGSLAEQYHRETGSPLSAKHLTWSYASLLTASAARRGVEPKGWGAANATIPPGQCGTNVGPTVSVTFNVNAQTVWGAESIYITGSIDQLSGWSPERAIQLSADRYPTWSVTLQLPTDTNFSYKYIRKNGNQVVWESDPDRSNSSPSTGTKTINDVWKS
ncbi:glucoamylase [Coprinopsis marcescibilis]|uniref:Glucoamylase n=1 Tax=Coprinopsis marcescibilis TaxID=230819 RepID=A0A5C3KW89_COPMA|nr:glucoamylase [Coprinopsis marcescibilis]